MITRITAALFDAALLAMVIGVGVALWGASALVRLDWRLSSARAAYVAARRHEPVPVSTSAAPSRHGLALVDVAEFACWLGIALALFGVGVLVCWVATAARLLGGGP